MIINFAERAHNHNWELDPVTRSLLDTDFYKLLMLQFIWKLYPKTPVSFSLLNRSTSVRLADMFRPEELAQQMEHVRSLRFRKSELIWLAGNTFYGQRGIFEPAFLAWLERDFRLSDYDLLVKDGQFHLSFNGLWTETTMWEIYALSIIDELKTRAALKKLSAFGLDVLYARAKTKLWGKIEQLRGALIVISAPAAAIRLSLTIHAVTGTAPDVRGTPAPAGWPSAGLSCCPSVTFTSSSRCRTNSPL